MVCPDRVVGPVDDRVGVEVAAGVTGTGLAIVIGPQRIVGSVDDSIEIGVAKATRLFGSDGEEATFFEQFDRPTWTPKNGGALAEQIRRCMSVLLVGRERKNPGID